MFGWFKRRRDPVDRKLLNELVERAYLIEERLYRMAVDLTKLNAAVARAVAASEALLAAHDDSAGQAAVDAAADALDAESVKVEAAVAPAPAPVV